MFSNYPVGTQPVGSDGPVSSSTAPPDPVEPGDIDAALVPTKRKVVFQGNKRVVTFPGNKREVTF